MAVFTRSVGLDFMFAERAVDIKTRCPEQNITSTPPRSLCDIFFSKCIFTAVDSAFRSYLAAIPVGVAAAQACRLTPKSKILGCHHRKLECAESLMNVASRVSASATSGRSTVVLPVFVLAPSRQETKGLRDLSTSTATRKPRLFKNLHVAGSGNGINDSPSIPTTQNASLHTHCRPHHEAPGGRRTRCSRFAVRLTRTRRFLRRARHASGCLMNADTDPRTARSKHQREVFRVWLNTRNHHSRIDFNPRRDAATRLGVCIRRGERRVC